MSRLPAAGNELGGRYRLVDRIGRGGMGEVWRAQDLRDNREVALKVFQAPDAVTRRVLDDAEVAAPLRHRGLVELLHAGRTPTGAAFLVMELLRGETLERRIQRQGPLPAAAAMSLLAQVCDALEYTHRAGIVHRDLSPANIHLEPESRGWRCKVFDFGIARVPDPAGGDAGEDLVFGTPSYMAPEQVRGGALDGRTDVYALGCVAHFALTGRPPFEGHDRRALLASHLSDAPPSLSRSGTRVPGRWDPWLARALAKSPDDRFRSMLEAREALAHVLGRGRLSPLAWIVVGAVATGALLAALAAALP